MLDNIKSYLLFGNRFCGIEYSTVDNEIKLFSTVLKRTKNQLEIDETIYCASIEEIKNQLPKIQHAALTVNDDKVLTKIINAESQDYRTIVLKAFPNINFDEFYYELIIQDSFHVVSICRRKHVDNLIEQFSDHKIKIISFSLGISILASILKYIETHSISTLNSALEVSNGAFISIKPTEFSVKKFYDINGLEASNETIISLSTALKCVLETRDTLGNLEGERIKLFKDFKQKQTFYNSLKVLLGLVFITLLVNFMVFNHFYHKVQELEQVNGQSSVLRLKTDELNEQLSKSEHLSEMLSMNAGSNSSYYITEIIAILPEEITLSELNFQPIKKRIKENTAVEVAPNTIDFWGTSSDKNVLSSWLKMLEDQTFVSKINITNFSENSEDVAEFEIKLILTEND